VNYQEFKQFKLEYEKKKALELQNLFNTAPPEVSTVLSSQRNKYSFRIKKGAAPLVLAHKNNLALQIYLELKPFFISGIIFNEAGALPYKKIASELRISESNLRSKLAQLKKLKLVKFDIHKNLILAPYRVFYKVIKHNFKGQQIKTANNYEQTNTILQSISICENALKQKHIIFEKICIREFSYTKEVPIIARDSFFKKLYNHKADLKLWKAIKKSVSKNFDFFHRKYERIFNYHYEQLDVYNSSAPEARGLNPNVNICCSNAAKLINRKALSSGYIALQKAAKAGFINLYNSYRHINKNSPAVWEFLTGMRADLFSYKYPTKNGVQRMYFINNPYMVESLI